MTVLRWQFVDPSDGSEAGSYTLPWNPQSMTSPFRTRAITTKPTTAIDGQDLVWEARGEPVAWSFRGKTKNAAHYEALRSWVEDRQGRMYVYDHFGRRLTVAFRKFDATPPEKMHAGRYWEHDYTVEALVFEVTAPTVDDGGPL